MTTTTTFATLFIINLKWRKISVFGYKNYILNNFSEGKFKKLQQNELALKLWLSKG
jgi:hypothetical protein